MQFRINLILVLTSIIHFGYAQLPPPGGGGGSGGIFGDDTVCVGATRPYSSLSSDGPFIWSVDGGIADSPFSSSTNIYWTGSGTGHIHLQYNGSSYVDLDVSIVTNSGGIVSGTSSVCYGGSASLSVSGGDPVVRWESSPNGSTWTTISSTSTTINPSNLTSTTIYRALRATGSPCGNKYTTNKTVSVYGALNGGTVIGNTNIDYGDLGGTISSQAGGSGGTGSSGYQWEKKEIGASSWSDISGATSASLGLNSYGPMTITTDYRRRYSNNCGTVYSNTQRINVNVPSGFGGNGIAGFTSVCQNSQQRYAAMSSSGPYIWSVTGGIVVSDPAHPECHSNGSCVIVQWDDVSTGGTIHLSYDGGNQYGDLSIEIVSNNGGYISGNSTICNGDDVELSVGTAPILYWQMATASSGWSWANVSSTANPITFYDLTENTKFQAVTNVPVCGNIYTQPKLVTVASIPDGGYIAGVAPIFYNEVSPRIQSLTPGTGGLGAGEYKWQKRANGQLIFSDIQEPNTDLSYYDPGQLTMKTDFRRKFINGCEDVFSNEVTVLVSAPDCMGNGWIFGTQCLCTDLQGDIIQYRAMVSSSQYFWEVISGGYIPDAIDNQESVNVIWNASSGKLRLHYLDDGGNFQFKDLDVNLTLPITQEYISGDEFTCPGNQIHLFLETGGSVIRWDQSPLGSNSWTAIPESASSDIDVTYSSGAWSFRAVRGTNICGEVFTQTKDVYPYPDVDPGLIGNDVGLWSDDPVPPIQNIQLAIGYVTGSIEYSWYKKELNGDWTLIENETQESLPLQDISVSTRFKRLAYETGGCSTSFFSNEISYTMLDVNHLTEFTAKESGLTSIPDLINPDHNKLLVTSNYYDGLGRFIQNVKNQFSPANVDIVQEIQYDKFGRPSVNYLPYKSSSSDGAYKPEAINVSDYLISDQYLFYQMGVDHAQDSKPFSQTLYEPSPLNRPLKQGAPGAAWQPVDNDPYSLNDHTVKMRYELNIADDIILFSYDPVSEMISADDAGAIKYYNQGQLFANKTYDEANNQVIEYVDKEGRTVCKKVQYAGDEVNPVFASTYYIYDDFGNLVVVLPPEAVNSALSQLTGN